MIAKPPYCANCQHFRRQGWCTKHDNYVTALLTCEDWEQAKCSKCKGTGRAWALCEFTTNLIMADCECIEETR